MSIYVSKEVVDEVAGFTDVGSWKCAWHWERDHTKAWEPLTLRGAEHMLHDLHCDGPVEEELAAAERKIRDRYDLAARLRRLIDEAKVVEIADSHDEGCDCQFCVAAGYVKTLGEKGQRPCNA
jgi:hypothetical protein